MDFLLTGYLLYTADRLHLGIRLSLFQLSHSTSLLSGHRQPSAQCAAYAGPYLHKTNIFQNGAARSECSGLYQLACHHDSSMGMVPISILGVDVQVTLQCTSGAFTLICEPYAYAYKVYLRQDSAHSSLAICRYNLASAIALFHLPWTILRTTELTVTGSARYSNSARTALFVALSNLCRISSNLYILHGSVKHCSNTAACAAGAATIWPVGAAVASSTAAQPSQSRHVPAVKAQSCLRHIFQSCRAAVATACTLSAPK